ncbi:MAG: M23 family metallopeptidase, partial [Anaerolineae bacterium]|nr:M23 family metallopeptidase [Anaerolineae bacterium]
TLKTGQSLMELSILHGISPWSLVVENQLDGSWGGFPGDTFYYPDPKAQGPSALPEVVSAVSVSPAQLIQGQTMVIHLDADSGAELAGYFNGLPLNFFEIQKGKYVAMQGIHAMLDPGGYDLSITGILGDDLPIAFSQKVLIQDGSYIYDPPLVVNSETVDFEINEVENQAWFDAVAAVSPDKHWDGVFQSPVPEIFSECFPSLFGNRRSYNNGGYYFFHTGIDFCGSVGVEIYAPAAGKVVFTDMTVVRGNATIIDHGWGVFSAYAHQDDVLVSKGDNVEKGQLIGHVGATGRVTGPHLHWEVMIGGVQVNPLQWMQSDYP